MEKYDTVSHTEGGDDETKREVPKITDSSMKKTFAELDWNFATVLVAVLTVPALQPIRWEESNPGSKTANMIRCVRKADLPPLSPSATAYRPHTGNHRHRQRRTRMPAAGAAAPAVDEGAGQPQEDPELPEQRPREGGRSSFMRPLVVLALPGMYLFYKYNQYRQEQRELSRRRVTERELQHLHHKIGAHANCSSLSVFNNENKEGSISTTPAMAVEVVVRFVLRFSFP
ncbi:hypothetical protein G5I_08837 [Acromyrmex echinatior]|uniref:Uncharacterized protein n=1 Tax=Acromyrmex echinatior TaxID=103372 RepID=F4WSH7_ACREC|nr:hypothetical protein G5I_08837 [Acromyrmex echinatior]